MSDLFLLSQAQMRRIAPYFPLSHGIPRVDDRRVISGIIFVIKNGLRWRDAPKDYGPHKTIYNRFIRWSELGVFNRIFAELAGKGAKPDRLMIDATHLKAHPQHRRQPAQKGGCSPTHRAHEGRLELPSFTRRAMVRGRPLVMLLSEGQMSDGKGAAPMLDALPPAKTLLGDRGYDAGWFRNALAKRGIVPCIPSKTNRKISIPHDRTLYHQRHKIENMPRQAQGLATHPYPLRPLLPHLFLSHLYRSNRHLLDQTMSPEPSHVASKVRRLAIRPGLSGRIATTVRSGESAVARTFDAAL